MVLVARWCGLACLCVLLVLASRAASAADSPYAAWKHGPPSDPNYFPIAVWCQSPGNAAKFQAAGINLYVALWKGPTEKQLAELKAAGMPVICAQNDVGLKHLDDPLIVGWMHGDEPDNAQAIPGGKGYGPPVPPKTIEADYRRIRARDPSRPVMLNLGQGVAWDGWVGRGVRTNHPEDYVEYVKGCDLASFDIYPAVSQRPQVAGKLWYVARGVQRLRKWAGPERTVWTCIECTRIGNPNVKPTPHQVRAEVWMALIHGSQGLIWFVHQFKPTFIEPGLLADPEMLAAVTRINGQVHELAAVLNGPTVERSIHPNSPAAVGEQAPASGGVPDRLAARDARGKYTVETSPADVPVDFMVKRHGKHTYVFAVCMAAEKVTARFRLSFVQGDAEVLGEGRKVAVRDGAFQDDFQPYDVHIYKLP
ncbi:MAG TPA: hypothetical protein VM695_09915 [Phycisphaerae bacterium]|nr:hypothetical protein [Phycisphaerae bacterium]